jgi:peptide/nickel transport system permease protein
MSYLARRLLQALPTLWCALTLAFVLVHLAPGGPVVALSGEYSTAEIQRDIEAAFGLDRPMLERYLRFVGAMLAGDLGHSYYFKKPVIDVLLERLAATLTLMAPALALSSLGGIWAGMLAARRANDATGLGVTVLVLGSYAIPAFWLAQLLVLVFAVQLAWFPVHGMTAPLGEATGVGLWAEVAYRLVLPVAALSLHNLAFTTMVTRARMRDEMRNPYFRTALAKGLPVATAMRRHALRNAMLPIVTVIGSRVGFLFAGAVMVETVFAWPGLGRLIVAASLNRDYPVVLGLFLLVSVAVLAANLATDLIYAAIDPRVRQGRRIDV